MLHYVSASRLRSGLWLLLSLVASVGLASFAYKLWLRRPARPSLPLLLLLAAYIFSRLNVYLDARFRAPEETADSSDLVRDPHNPSGSQQGSPPERIGVVLCGGGGKGAYQVGALEALKQAGITFSLIAGTSAGALNGALFLSGGIENAKRVWVCAVQRAFRLRLYAFIVALVRAYAAAGDRPDFAVRKALTRGLAWMCLATGSFLIWGEYLLSDSYWRFFFASFVLFHGFQQALMNGLWLLCEHCDLAAFDNRHLQALIQEHVSHTQIRQSATELVVTVSRQTSLFDPLRPTTCGLGLSPVVSYVPVYTALRTCTPGEANQYLLATASIPFGILNSVSIGSERYVDGGVVDNAPVLPALEANCDAIIIVHTNHRGKANGRILLSKTAVRLAVRNICRRLALAKRSPVEVMETYRARMGAGRGLVWRTPKPDLTFQLELGQCGPRASLDGVRLVHIVPSRPLGSLLRSLVFSRPERVAALIQQGYDDAATTIREAGLA
jgi:predicted acylesterase/phospholipase RssA